MIELMKKTMLIGMGLALKTRDEMQDLVKEISEKGKVSEEEGREFLDEILDKCDEARESFEKNVESSVSKVLKKMDLVTAKEFNGVKEELHELKERVAAMDEGKADD